MRTLKKNKQKLCYALLIGTEPEYVYDENGNKKIDYVDEEGNIYYQMTGKEKPIYSGPVEIMANISMSGGEAIEQEYGIDTSGYDAVVITELKEFPITETSLIWYENDPADSAKADYKVLFVKNSLNYTKLLLGRLVK